MKIYTRTGDKGKTSLFDGTRVRKDNIRVETYGIVDELNSVIGVILSEMKNENIKNKNDKEKLKNELIQIQNNLFDIGSILANPNKEFTEKERQYFEKRVLEFEHMIDEMTGELSELSNFILPGGGRAGALLHLARTVCRRAERRIISLSQEAAVPREIIMFFNRLSDLLFTMSRWANWIEGKKEVEWKKGL